MENCSDGADNDCDGNTDCADDDCETDTACMTCTDADGDGYCAEESFGGEMDCDDTDPGVNPGAGEIAGDGIDNDCDGEIDESDGDNDNWDPCFIDTLM